MTALRSIRQAGIDITRVGVDIPASVGKYVDAVLEVPTSTTPARFAVEEKGRAPYPNELHQLEGRRAALCRVGHPLLVVPFVLETLARIFH